MDFRKQFAVRPGTKVKLSDIDPGYTGKYSAGKEAAEETQKYLDRLCKLQLLLYSEKKHSVLIVLQAVDAAGKDGTVNHVMSAMNPQGTTVTGFKQPTAVELDHDFLWRIHLHAPAKGTVAIFNRSHYEDVLVTRVHKLAPKKVWSERYEMINDFEKLLHRQNHTQIIKFFLHIGKQEQLARFKQRLKDPDRNWKISESDYKEREHWDAYTRAFEQVFAETSRKDAPWYIIPSNQKWFRNLAVSQILAESMEDLKMTMPKPQVDLEVIRREYYRAAGAEDGAESRAKAGGGKKRKKAGKK